MKDKLKALQERKNNLTRKEFCLSLPFHESRSCKVKGHFAYLSQHDERGTITKIQHTSKFFNVFVAAAVVAFMYLSIETPNPHPEPRWGYVGDIYGI